MHELHEQDKATRQRFDLALKGDAPGWHRSNARA